MPKGVYERKPRNDEEPDGPPEEPGAATPELPPAPKRGRPKGSTSKAKPTRATCLNFLRAGYLLAKAVRKYEAGPAEEDLTSQAEQLEITLNEVPILAFLVRLAAPLVLVGMIANTVAGLERRLREARERRQAA